MRQKKNRPGALIAGTDLKNLKQKRSNNPDGSVAHGSGAAS